MRPRPGDPGSPPHLPPLGVPVAVLRCRQTHAGVYGPCVHSWSKLTPEQRPQTLGHEVSRPVGGGGLALGHTLPSEPASVGSKAGPCMGTALMGHCSSVRSCMATWKASRSPCSSSSARQTTGC